MTPREVIASAKVDFLGEAGDTVALLAIAALNKAGFVIVPKEPTEKMLLAPGEPYASKIDRAAGLNARRKAWHKMLNAVDG